MSIAGGTGLTAALYPTEVCDPAPPPPEQPNECLPVGSRYHKEVNGPAVTEVVFYHEHDTGQFTWGIGANGTERSFTVEILDNPDRLAIDIGG